jgi:acyl-CoA thioesterase-1
MAPELGGLSMVGGFFGNDPARPHRDDASGTRGEDGVVRHQHQGGAALPVEREEHFHHRGAGCSIEIPGGFVGKENPWRPRKRPRKGDALLFAAGELVGVMAQPFAETDPFENGLCPRTGSGLAAQFKGHQHVLKRGEGRNELKILEHKPHGTAAQEGPRVLIELSKRVPVEFNAARGGVVQTGAQPEQRGFPTAGGADNRTGFPGKDAQLDVAQNSQGTARLFVGFYEVTHLQNWHVAPRHHGINHDNTLLHDVDSRKNGMPEMNKRRFLLLGLRRLLCLFPCAALLPCGASAADAAAAPGGARHQRVVILGDSITAGYGLERHEAFPAVLQRKVTEASLPFEIVAAGVSGDTTAGGLRRVKWAFGSGAAVFVIALGGNDGLRGLPPGETEENLANIIRTVRSLNPQTLILLAGMKMPANLGTDYVAAFDAVYPKVASAYKTLFVPFLLEGVGGVPALNQADMIHPTAEGQRMVADLLWQILGPILRKLASE